MTEEKREPFMDLVYSEMLQELESETFVGLRDVELYNYNNSLTSIFLRIVVDSKQFRGFAGEDVFKRYDEQ